MSRIDAFDWAFCTQVGHTGPLRPSETGRPIPYIDQIALDFPELVIVWASASIQEYSNVRPLQGLDGPSLAR